MLMKINFKINILKQNFSLEAVELLRWKNFKINWNGNLLCLGDTCKDIILCVSATDGTIFDGIAYVEQYSFPCLTWEAHRVLVGQYEHDQQKKKRQEFKLESQERMLICFWFKISLSRPSNLRLLWKGNVACHSNKQRVLSAFPVLQGSSHQSLQPPPLHHPYVNSRWRKTGSILCFGYRS